MLISILEHSILTCDLVGRLGRDLSVLKNGSLPVVPTIFISKDAFWAFQSGDLDTKIYEEAFELISKTNRDGDLLVYCSLSHDSIWCEKEIPIKGNSSALRNAVERVFRSIMTSRSRASRAAFGFPEEDAAPAILLQALVKRGGRVMSRHAVSGQPTDETNWRDNINNQIPTLSSECIDLSRRAEALLGKPLQVFFEAKPTPAIFKTETATMTIAAKLVALVDLMNLGAIDKFQLIEQLEPSMFGYLQKYELDRASKIDLVAGLAAFPGQALGRVVLRRFNRDSKNKLRPILFLKEYSPDDSHDINDAAASVGCVGGLTSHLAAVCRNLGKPCVVSTQLTIDERKRVITNFMNGRSIAEDSPVLVDGTEGTIAFSDSPELVPKYSIVCDDNRTRQTILEVVRDVAGDNRFSHLSVDQQKHFASIKYRLGELGIE